MQFPFLKPRPKTTPSTSIDSNPFVAIHRHFTSLLAHLPNPDALSVVSALGNHARQAFHAAASRLSPPPPPGRSPPWARLAPAPAPAPASHRSDIAMSTEAIEERLAGVPVYALSNSDEEFVLVSGARTGRSLGLFCFKEEDAQALLDHMKSMDQSMRQGSKVVALALNKVFQLKVDGVAFRFIPDSCQVANAIKEKEKAGDTVDGFSGVPVFQSRSLVLRSQNKRYRPVFFRKEDLEDSLRRASRQQRKLNPALRQGDIQVGVLEEIIEAMKGSSQQWDDVVFIPPGLDVPTGVAVERSIASA